ncbi:hypothetical protein M8994_13060 [Brucella sp. 21LCYQ03]|nr:hypothetical protein [Brucella sp. 21LCYQ03]
MAIETKAGTSGPTDVLLVGTPPVTVATPVTTVPSGTQEVRVTNPQPAPVINITVNATTNASPQEVANQTMGVFASQYRAATGGAYSDGGM